MLRRHPQYVLFVHSPSSCHTAFASHTTKNYGGRKLDGVELDFVEYVAGLDLGV